MYFELASEITASSRSRLVGASPISRAFGGGMARGAGAAQRSCCGPRARWAGSACGATLV